MVAPANAVRLYKVPPKRRKSSSPSGVRLKGTPMRSSRSMIPGAASHIFLTGGWLPENRRRKPCRQSACQVESPSPFRFFAALIPPCAQTECDRFTGTMENRSTLAPISAILITADKSREPAAYHNNFRSSPSSSHRPSVARLFAAVSRAHAGVRRCRPVDPVRGRERNEYKLANPAPLSTKKNARHTRRQPLLRFLSRNNAPLRARTARFHKRNATKPQPVPQRRTETAPDA